MVIMLFVCCNFCNSFNSQNSRTLYKGFIIFVALVFCAGCAPHRSASIGWEGNRIRLQITPPGGSTLFNSPSLRCVTCNEVLPPIPLSENNEGVAYIKLEEALQNITSRFHIEAGGLDSALVLQPRSPAESNVFYKLQTPIVGRIFMTSFAHIYADTSMTISIGELQKTDEANLFRENDVFYFIHHPSYDHPVVVLRSQAIRLQ